MIAAMRAGNPSGNVRASAYFVRMDPGIPSRRRLSWTPERTIGVVYHVLMDGQDIIVSDTTEAQIKSGNLFPRSVIEVIETSPQNRQERLLNVATGPDNRVICTWAAVDGATSYELFRKEVAGSYGRPIFKTKRRAQSYRFSDGPLEDGSYVYKLESVDDDGDLTLDEEPVIISAAPIAPTSIDASWNPTTHVFTITWGASPSSDVDHYAIRHNSGSGPIQIDDAPEDTTVLLTFSIDLTGLTGGYEFLVRTVDGDSKEEQNIGRLVSIQVIAGVAQGTPASPVNIAANSIAGSKAQVRFRYYPSSEQGFAVGGIAKEARIYYDNGTGVIDFVTPLGLVAMDFPTVPTSYSFDSGVLSNGDYLFAVRIATATAGGGVETTNDEERAVTINSDVPAATNLLVEVF